MLRVSQQKFLALTAQNEPENGKKKEHQVEFFHLGYFPSSSWYFSKCFIIRELEYSNNIKLRTETVQSFLRETQSDVTLEEQS